MGFDLLKLSLILLVIGGLNWGAVGLLGKDLVVTLLGRGTATKAVYVLVGLAAVIVGAKIFGLTEGFENPNNGMNNANNGMNSATNNANNGMNNANNEAEGFYACNPDTEEEDGAGGCKPKDM
jgi:uncharacterized membrane protein YuzA (DUF378 family)